MEPFDCFSPDALRFLTDLKANNSRDWFTANKATYETRIKEPTRRFAVAMADALGELTGHSQSSRVFRIYRDVRFSADKTPYNTHIHLSFAPEGLQDQPPMWFFGLSPEKLTLGCGVFQYDKAALTAFREAMAGPDGAALIALTARLDGQGIRVGDPDLKRIPPGFDKDHPNDEALRRKGYAAWIDRDDTGFATQPALVARTRDEFRRLLPVYSFLSKRR